MKKPVKLALAALAGAYATAQLVRLTFRALEPAAAPRGPEAQAWAAGDLAGSLIGLVLGGVACLALLVSAFRRPPRAARPEADSEAGRPAEPAPRATRLEAVPVGPPPRAARAAGLIWLVVGSFLVLTTCGGLIASLLIEVRRPGPATPSPTAGCSTGLSLLIAVGFVVAGLRVARGTARDTVVPGVLSLLLGLYFLVNGLLMLSALPAPREPAGAAADYGARKGKMSRAPAAYPDAPADQDADDARLWRVLAILTIATGYALLVPGGLALFGRANYLRWRAGAPSPPAPRHRERRPQAEAPPLPPWLGPDGEVRGLHDDPGPQGGGPR